MTFEEALHKKIYKLRLSFFAPTAYCDPRVIEMKSGVSMTPILDPLNTTIDGDGTKIYTFVFADDDQWEPI